MNLEFDFTYVAEPMVDFRLTNPDSGRSVMAQAIVDTGADLSLLDEELAVQIGLDLNAASSIALAGVSGGLLEARQTDVVVSLLDERQLTTILPLAFAPGVEANLGNLIGLDILSFFDFGLAHSTRTGYLGRTDVVGAS